jgi:hypothetical protein
MLLKHAQEGKVQVIANILLKVNANLGGCNAVLGINTYTQHHSTTYVDSNHSINTVKLRVMHCM